LIVIGNIGPWSAGITETERIARCRKLRALALVYLGPEHPLTAALGEAITDGGALETARAQLGAIPALRRRRLLAAYIALLRAAAERAYRMSLLGLTDQQLADFLGISCETLYSWKLNFLAYSVLNPSIPRGIGKAPCRSERRSGAKRNESLSCCRSAGARRRA